MLKRSIKLLRKNGRAGARQGFTLVELIVVLVILAILAALLIPSLTGYIDKARQKTAVAECRACVLAAQTLSSEAYGKGGRITLADDKAAILALAETPAGGDITGLEISATATVTKLVYKTAGGVEVVYENGTYTINGVSTKNLGDPDTRQEVIDVLKKECSSSADSGAAAIPGSNSAAVVDALKKQGLNLGTLGATSWRFEKGNPSILLWSTRDVSTYKVGDKVPVMRYNLGTGTYNAGYVTVKEGSTGADGNKTKYNVFSNFNFPTPNGNPPDAKDQTYEKMVEYFNKLLNQ